MIKNDTLKKYSEALFSVATEEKSLEIYKKEFSEIVSLMINNKDIFDFMNSYFVEEAEKDEIIDVLVKNKKSAFLGSFLKICVKSHIFYRLETIYFEFNKLVNSALGIKEGFVYSTYELSDKEMAKIKDAISKVNKGDVELENKIDESLIGGVKVTLGDQVYDGSIKHKLDDLKNDIYERRQN